VVVDAIRPSIQVSKLPALTTVSPGGLVTFTILAKNVGDVELTDVSVSDPAVPACGAVVGLLGIGAQVSYTCTTTAEETFTNVALAVGDDPNGDPVLHSDTAQVQAFGPRLFVPAVARNAAEPSSDLSTSTKMVDTLWANAGETLAYTISVLNTGPRAANVSLSDPVPASTVLSGTVQGGVYNNGRVEWQGMVGAGSAHTVTFAVQIDEDASGQIVNVATIDDQYHDPFWRVASTRVLVSNPGLETGDFTGWQHGGALAQTIQSGETQAGGYAALLGDPGYDCLGGVPVGSAWMEQTMLVPAVGSPELSFWYRIYSHDHLRWTTGQWGDAFYMYINGGVILRDNYDNYPLPAPGCDNLQDSGWKHYSFDLSPWRGQQITVRFENTSVADGYYNTWSYVDDVTITP
jgi:uncharacterized repeat protein (TIGR01451 family)